MLAGWKSAAKGTDLVFDPRFIMYAQVFAFQKITIHIFFLSSLLFIDNLDAEQTGLVNYVSSLLCILVGSVCMYSDKEGEKEREKVLYLKRPLCCALWQQYSLHDYTQYQSEATALAHIILQPCGTKGI